MVTNSSTGKSTAREIADPLFADLVEQIGELVDVGRGQAANELIDQHPQYADRLRRLLRAIEALTSLDDRIAPLKDNAGGPAQQLGDFRILREVGRGGMGIVYEAEQASLRRRVALKVLPLAATLSARQLQRFKNEARAAAALKHPNIVGVHSVGVERGVHYYAMELVDGRSLASVIAELTEGASGAPPKIPTDRPTETSPVANLSTLHSERPAEYFSQAARLIADAADALDYAHGQGVVHRDIKPANLLIDDESQLFVTDFGLARLESDAGVTLTGDILGTLRYMSPEQAAGKPGHVDCRSDIHALGATLYELLTLRPAFDGDNRADLLRRVAEETPARLRRCDSKIPVDLETIVHKAMEKDPDERYDSAGQLASDLRAFASHRPIAARPATLATRMHKWTRRHSRAVAAGVLVLLLGVVCLTISTVMISRQRSVALRNAESAQLSAQRANDNFQLALKALEETLAESVAGNLVVRYSDPKHKELEKRGIAFYEEFARKNKVDPSTWPTYRLLVCNQQLGQALALMAEDPDAAENVFRQALSMADALWTGHDQDPRFQARLIDCLNEFHAYLRLSGRMEEANAQLDRSGDLANRLLSDHPDFLPAHYLVGINQYNRGVRHQDAGQLPLAEESYRQALTKLKQARDIEPNEVRNPHTLAKCQYNLGMLYATTERSNQAEQLWQQSLTTWRGLILMRPGQSEFHSRAGATLSNLAALASQAEDYEQCRELAQGALVHQKHALEIEPAYEFAREFLRSHYRHLSLALSALHEREALAALQEERVALLSDVPHEYCDAAISLADCLEQLNADKDYAREDRQQLMDKYAQRALELLDLAAKRFDEQLPTFRFAEHFVRLGDRLLETDRPNDARRAWLSAERLFKRVRDSVAPEDKHEFDEHLESTRERLLSIAVESDDLQ